MLWARRLRRHRYQVLRHGAYELRVFVRHAGTRSEGRVGRLFADGRELRAAQPGDTVTAGPGGPTFVYLGGERTHLWSPSGWAIQGPDGAHLRLPSADAPHDGTT